jgi:D-arabinose 1-dehydrogenase-like Zn-dependent alcohol dehydrogenase
VLDFCWGRPAECLLEALSGSDLMAEAHTTRYIHIGEMAGSTIRLPGSVLRSAGIELHGQGGGSVPKEVMAKIPTEIIPYLFQLAVEGKIRIDTEAVPLRDVSEAWQRKETGGKRLVAVVDRKLR